MPTTDTRTGFRLPWTGDQRPDGEQRPDGDQPEDGASSVAAAPAAATDPTSPATTATAGERPAARKPSKFLADLGRAMLSAAETAREESLARLQADAKAYVEEIHSRSADGATVLRRRADDDVAEIREWSKAEMARIREETEARIAERKVRLEAEVDEHAAGIERRVTAIESRVAGFQQEMDEFFGRLLAESDPSRIASLAENLPEPPAFDDVDMDPAPAPEATAAEPVVAEASEPASEDVPEPSVEADEPAPDFAAAEAEALSGVDHGSDGLARGAEAAAPAHGDHTAAAASPTSGRQTTTVVVTGLVSVASIAGFKRQLGRQPGVASVAVSSGPDGEFVFTVAHDDAVALREAVPALPGFGATVTGERDDVLEVTARDPDPAS